MDGDSIVRSRYPIEGWADEVMAAAEAAGIAGRPYIVGHSMGGRVAAVVGAGIGNRLRAWSSSIHRSRSRRRNPSSGSWAAGRRPTRPGTRFAAGFARSPNRRSCSRTWRGTWPRNRCATPATGGSGNSIPRCCASVSAEDVSHPWGSLRTVAAPVLYIRRERGLVTRARALEIAGVFGRPATIVELAEAGHHPMMDQPLPLVATVRTALAQWGSPE